METNTPPQKPFLKTGFGITLAIILGFITLIALVFASFFIYYLYQEKYGSPDTQKRLAEKFNPSFSAANSLKGIPKVHSDKNVASFIRPSNPTLGIDKAPVTIVAFIDFECPYCHQSYPIFENVLKKFGPTVRVVFKHFPIEAIHPNARNAALHGSCVAAQGRDKFWKFYNSAFLAEQLDSNTLDTLAMQTGINQDLFQSCLEDDATSKQVFEDLQDGIDLGVEGTPTYFVNQRKIQGVISEDDWGKVIVGEIQAKKQ